ncbi:MAG: hypothetical protein ABIR62_00790 [Dokdonella sp.]|uniref:hypothetical protein n=1 Tax=Dokdonella sp. TaxID=2291710 RepID=UPI00326717E6
MRATPILAVLLINLAMPCAFALEGDVDPAFGTGGQWVMPRPNDVSSGEKQPGDVVVLGDGRFLWSAPLDDDTILIGRSGRNGAPDVAFGGDGTGRITLPICGENYRPSRMIGDGASGVIVWSDRCLRHVDADGSVDSAFGAGSMPPSSFLAADLARDPSGRLLLAGRDGPLGEVYRFNEDGALDETFGTAGKVVLVAAEGSWSSVNALAIRPDGRILVGGSGGAGNDSNLFVVQLQPDGLPDPGWDEDGSAVLVPPTGFHTLQADALAIDSDGSVVVSGMGNNGMSSCCILLTRLDATGHVVADFGVRLFELSGNTSFSGFGEQRGDVVILPNHRIIIGTHSFPTGSPLKNHRTQYTLVRTFADGHLDSEFGHDGWNSYTIVESEGASPAGDYNQLHAIGYDADDDSMLILGRTFFEESGSDVQYVSMVRARFDLVFDDAFE